MTKTGPREHRLCPVCSSRFPCLANRCSGAGLGAELVREAEEGEGPGPTQVVGRPAVGEGRGCRLWGCLQILAQGLIQHVDLGVQFGFMGA